MSLASAPEGATLQITGARVTLRQFSMTHGNDPAYRGWLRDPEIVRTLNLPDYLENPVSDAEIETYCERVMASLDDLFLAIHDLSVDAFIGTIKAGRIDSYARHADIGIMIGRKDLGGRGWQLTRSRRCAATCSKKPACGG